MFGIKEPHNPTKCATLVVKRLSTKLITYSGWLLRLVNAADIPVNFMCDLQGSHHPFQFQRLATLIKSIRYRPTHAHTSTQYKIYILILSTCDFILCCFGFDWLRLWFFDPDLISCFIFSYINSTKFES